MKVDEHLIVTFLSLSLLNKNYSYLICNRKHQCGSHFHTANWECARKDVFRAKMAYRLVWRSKIIYASNRVPKTKSGKKKCSRKLSKMKTCNFQEFKIHSYLFCLVSLDSLKLNTFYALHNPTIPAPLPHPESSVSILLYLYINSSFCLHVLWLSANFFARIHIRYHGNSHSFQNSFLILLHICLSAFQTMLVLQIHAPFE